MNWAGRQPSYHRLPSWDVASIEGQWPKECNGTLLRNGPALFQRGGETKRHLFDGDGLVQAWDFCGGSIRHKASWIQTSKFNEEQREGRFLYPGFADSETTHRAIKSPDDFNTANTNIIYWNGKLLALWEAGSAHELDPINLETIGPKIWSPETQAAPFGAHPKLDDQGRLWNIGISGNHLLVYVINPDGSLASVRLLTIRPCAMAHDFFLTEHYLGVWLAPIHINPQDLHKNGRLLSAMEWRDQDGSQLLLIDRDSLEITKIVELEAELIFHFANVWEEDQHLNICYIRNSFEQLHADLLIAPENETQAGVSTTVTRACFRRIRLDTGEGEMWQGVEHVEFPQFDERYRGKPCGTFFSLLSTTFNSHSVFNGILRQDIANMCTQRWIGGEEIELEEHVYVPKDRSDRKAGGWLVGSGFNSQRNQSFCCVFDADQLEDGPIAMAYLDAPAPICFHGQFLTGS